jgi:hypothetical protein
MQLNMTDIVIHIAVEESVGWGTRGRRRFIKEERNVNKYEYHKGDS